MDKQSPAARDVGAFFAGLLFGPLGLVMIALWDARGMLASIVGLALTVAIGAALCAIEFGGLWLWLLMFVSVACFVVLFVLLVLRRTTQ